MLCCAGSLSNCAFPPVQPIDNSWPLSIHAYHVLLWRVVLHCWRHHYPAVHHHSSADHLGRNLPNCDILVGSFGIDHLLHCAVPGAELQQEGELPAAPAMLPGPACCAFKLLHAVLSTCYTLCFAAACLLCCKSCQLNVLTQRLLLSCCKAGVLPANLLFFTAQLASSCQAAYDKSSFIQLLTQHVRPQQQLSNSSLICVCLRSGGILRRCGLPTSPT